MKLKIRINELARELEVKPNRILELLPEFGVTEKKTHSSSIDEDVAIAIKDRFGVAVGSSGNGSSYRATAVEEPPDAAEPEIHEPEPESPSHEPEREEPERIDTMPAPADDRPTARPSAVMPLRPPLASLRREPVQPPAAPPAPPQPAPSPAQPQAATPPAPSPSATPGQPAAQMPRPPAERPAGPSMPAPPAPAQPRNVPIYRPGQVISGPRQPLPADRPQEARTSSPGAPARPQSSPGTPMPRPPMQRSAPSIPVPRPQGPGAPQQPQRPPLAGQPIARPVVPPRPELVARIQQSRTGPQQPAAPAAPRPGMPTRPASPAPGQPIWRGPIRPGQPMARGPAGPGARTGPGQRPRPMHPTSPLRPEPATLPPGELQRRLQGKPAGRADRKKEVEEVERQLTVRREQTTPLAVNREITIGEGITVKELAEKLGIKSSLVIKKLVDRKIFATINQNLDVKLAEDLARDFGATSTQLTYEEEASWEIELTEEQKDLVVRPPVITVMGHVDHGKTSLLDYIRSSNVAAREAGGITQHIGASVVEKNGKRLIFIDTPGHEAFTRMRARGAKVTDIVILVVAADDGVMPQTLEAIDHAKAAKVPIIVAINKIDRPDAQAERIKQQLADRNLLAEDWGGDTVMVPLSAKTGQNVDLLLEMILLVSEMGNLKANPTRPAIGTVLEAELDKGRGPVATVLVQNGTLKIGDFFICGQVFGKVRAMYDHRGGQVREADPSTPVEVLGLDGLPEVGDAFQVVTDTAKAKQIVLYRESKAREQAMSKGARLTLEQLHEQTRDGDVKDLNIIIKTDVGGTAEVLSEMLQKLSTDKVKIRVISKNVGAITESDVLLASASNATIIGFNVRPERNAASLAEKEKIDVRLHTIIYELTDEIKKAMTGMLEPVFKEAFRGRATVLDVFRITKVGNVAGCMVNEGTLTRDSQVRLLRDNIVVHTGRIESLRRFKNDVSEVKSGFECGVTLANYQDIHQGDVIEAFVMEKVAVELT